MRRGWIVVAGVISTGAYLAFALSRNGDFGWPLDDAWIHQVYARNLGLRGEFSFFAGHPSAGSTSPLWALVLSPGYWPGMDYRVWTVALGVLLLGGSAWLAGKIANRVGERLNPGVMAAHTALWTMVLMLGEWHLVWASVSGMEVLLFVFLELALIELFLARANPIVLGALAGLLTLTRPEGAVLGGLVVVGLIAQGWLRVEPSDNASFLRRGRGALGEAAKFLVPLALLIAPYLYFNLAASGTIFPNTFYAKAEEYRALTNEPLVTRWLSLWVQPLTGAQVLLVPGILFLLAHVFRNKEAEGWKVDAGLLVPVVWAVSLVTLYALRLPVSYQHGRYEMPVIPFVVIFGVAGTQWLMGRAPRLIRRAVSVAMAVLVLAFWLIGANAYATDVSIINCEMVAAARWSAANIPAGELVAVHDIGAQEFFDSHALLDLAGLVTPDVIPFIRDEARIRTFIRERGAGYAILFPDWYPRLAEDSGLARVFTTGCALTREQGGQNLSVYQVNR